MWWCLHSFKANQRYICKGKEFICDIQVQHARCGGICINKKQIKATFVKIRNLSATFRSSMPDMVVCVLKKIVNQLHTFKNEESVCDTQVQHARCGGVCPECGSREPGVQVLQHPCCAPHPFWKWHRAGRRNQCDQGIVYTAFIVSCTIIVECGSNSK